MWPPIYASETPIYPLEIDGWPGDEAQNWGEGGAAKHTGIMTSQFLGIRGAADRCTPTRWTMRANGSRPWLGQPQYTAGSASARS